MGFLNNNSVRPLDPIFLIYVTDVCSSFEQDEHERPINEEHVQSAHQQAYSGGGASGMDAGSMGTAAAMQVRQAILSSIVASIPALTCGHIWLGSEAIHKWRRRRGREELAVVSDLHGYG